MNIVEESLVLPFIMLNNLELFSGTWKAALFSSFVIWAQPIPFLSICSPLEWYYVARNQISAWQGVTWLHFPRRWCWLAAFLYYSMLHRAYKAFLSFFWTWKYIFACLLFVRCVRQVSGTRFTPLCNFPKNITHENNSHNFDCLANWSVEAIRGVVL